ncbi:unnamed protein product [Nippostrongylus brasiliensis]|uniref:Secreted protein n=1 Tax=Nippostrongylus brasiliensis TaxID=27835 RepID=A0A0N4YTK0_NIPBR|nr:unnamed protein product [Nippostrongylus brasiliensis]
MLLLLLTATASRSATPALARIDLVGARVSAVLWLGGAACGSPARRELALPPPYALHTHTLNLEWLLAD